MTFYEVPIIIGDEIPSQGVAVIASKIIAIIENCQGKIVRAEFWGTRQLAYKIGKTRMVKYYYLIIQANADFGKEVVKYLNINEAIIRYMIATLEETNKAIQNETKLFLEYKKKRAETNIDDSAFANIFLQKIN